MRQHGLRFIGVVFLLLGSTLASFSQSRKIPNVILEFTVQQKVESKISQGYHVHWLFCADNRCSLRVLSLNQCSEERRFYPKLEVYSTDERTLGVLEMHGVLEVKVQYVGGLADVADATMRIGYAKLSPGQEYATEITSFSGAVVKHSTLLGKVITWELEPLQGDGSLVDVALDCKVALPAIRKTRR